MSLAEDLLNSIAEEIPAHDHSVTDSDTYFVINPITRTIENPRGAKNVIMQYDHNSERLTFELPRYIDGHDMLECTSVTVNVDNIEVDVEEPRINSDAPDMTDLRVHPSNSDKVISSWLISRNSTQLAGILSFSIEYKCVDINGNVVYEWSTDAYEAIQVKARKKNGTAAVIEHTDILEQWRTKLFGAGDSVMASIAAEGNNQIDAVRAESEVQQEAVEVKGAQTLDSIPEDYTNTSNAAFNADRTKGAAIINDSDGATIVLKDSSNDYIRGMKVFGKSTQVTTNGYQLFNANKLNTHTYGGATVTNNGDGSFTVSGSGTVSNIFNIHYNYTHEETLAILKAGSCHLVTEQKTMPYVYIQLRTDSSSLRDWSTANAAITTKDITQEILDNENIYLRIGFYAAAGADVVTGTIRPVLYMDGDGTYEPYSGGKPSPSPEWPQEIESVENANVKVYGKNLLENTRTTVTQDGVTFTVNVDKSITLNGTATQGIYFDICTNTVLEPGTYTMSGSPTTAHPDKFYMYMYPHYYADNSGKGFTFTIYEPTKFTTRIYVASGIECNNVTFYPQIERNSRKTDYEPYIPEQTIAITQNVPGIPVTSGGNYTDANGQHWICDEVDLERGVYVCRIGKKTFNGTESWNTGTSVLNGMHRYFTWVTDMRPDNSGFGLCTHYPRTPLAAETIYSECVRFGQNNTALFFFSNDIVTTDAWIAYVKSLYDDENPISVQYVLATPIETPLTAEEITAFKALRTNCSTTTIINDADAWMSVKYNADTKTYVENPKVLKLVDSSTGVVYELKVINGALAVNPV